MSDAVLVIGNSGSGKSTSMRTLDHQSNFIINVIDKQLPFKGWRQKYSVCDSSNPKGNIVCAYDPQTILKMMDYVDKKRPDFKTICIDDSQYIMSYMLMAKRKEKGYDKFTEIAGSTFDIFKKSRELRDDLVVFFLSHSETVSVDGHVQTKIKTIGKMLDEKICLEGLFSVVLVATAKKNFNKEMEYLFTTQTDGTTTAKSPMGMFEDIEIANDLKLVYEAINKFNKGEE